MFSNLTYNSRAMSNFIHDDTDLHYVDTLTRNEIVAKAKVDPEKFTKTPKVEISYLRMLYYFDKYKLALMMLGIFGFAVYNTITSSSNEQGYSGHHSGSTQSTFYSNVTYFNVGNSSVSYAKVIVMRESDDVIQTESYNFNVEYLKLLFSVVVYFVGFWPDFQSRKDLTSYFDSFKLDVGRIKDSAWTKGRTLKQLKLDLAQFQFIYFISTANDLVVFSLLDLEPLCLSNMEFDRLIRSSVVKNNSTVMFIKTNVQLDTFQKSTYNCSELGVHINKTVLYDIFWGVRGRRHICRLFQMRFRLSNFEVKVFTVFYILILSTSYYLAFEFAKVSMLLGVILVGYICIVSDPKSSLKILQLNHRADDSLAINAGPGGNIEVVNPVHGNDVENQKKQMSNLERQCSITPFHQDHIYTFKDKFCWNKYWSYDFVKICNLMCEDELIQRLLQAGQEIDYCIEFGGIRLVDFFKIILFCTKNRKKYRVRISVRMTNDETAFVEIGEEGEIRHILVDTLFGSVEQVAIGSKILEEHFQSHLKKDCNFFYFLFNEKICSTDRVG